MTATVSLRQTKRSGVSHARLQSRHPAPTSQSRFSSTKAEIRKVVDLDESFHTHRHDAITGAKKKKNLVSNVSSTIKRRITVFCDAVVHGDTGLIDSSSRRGTQRSPRTTVDVAKQKLLVEEPGWRRTGKSSLASSGAASQCAYEST